MLSYVLLNKSNTVCTFTLSDDYNYIYDVKSFGELPFCSSIWEWLNGRDLLAHKRNYKELCNLLGTDTLFGKIELTHCVSLFDSFWVKRTEDSTQWEDVSLYRVQFSEYMSDFMIGNVLPKPNRKHHISPEYNCSGSFDRCWCKIDNNIYMLKAGSYGYANAGREPYSEYYTNQLEKFLGFNNYVTYFLLYYNRRMRGRREPVKSVVTKCYCITSEDVGMVSASTLGIVDYKNLLMYCEETLGSVVKEKCIDMLILDCLTLNTDRHLSNVSFLMNNDTQKLIDIAPIYDNNLALIPGFMEEYDNLAEYANNLLTALDMEFTDLFKLCYEQSSHKQLWRERLRSVITNFKFVYFSIGEEIFKESRLSYLNTLVKSNASKYLELCSK